MDGQASFFQSKWFALSGLGALAASFIAGWLIINTPSTPAPETMAAAVAESAVSAFVNDDSEGEDFPTADVGEEYIGLLAGN